MPDLFASAPGTVAIFTDQRVIPGRIRVTDPAFPGSDNAPVLVSGVDYGQKTNQQFQQALDRSVFIYVFGDLMGTVAVRGTAFAATCDGSQSGLGVIFDYYTANRASVRDTPIIMEAGGETISGFLTGLDVRAANSGEDPSALMSEFSLIISALPKS